MIKTSVVILNWNGAKLLQQFLPTVLVHTQTEDCEVVVADNNSSDNSVQVMKQHFPHVKLIQLDKNYGFAEGYNRALQQIHSKYVVLLNSDVETSPNWLKPMLEHLERNPETVAVQPKILSYADKTKFEYAGAAGGFIDRYGYPYCRGRILHVLEEDRGQYDQPLQVFWASGACLCMRRADYMEAGGLDDDFFAHMEEIDLCWRLLARGKKIVCLPQSTVYHVGGASLDSESPRKVHLNFRNNLLMIYKNAPLIKLVEILIVRMVLDTAAAAHFLVQRKWKHAEAVANAYSDFFKMRPTFKHKRKENMQKSVQTNIAQQYKGSMLYEFYFKKRRKYSEL